ncbi:CLUMA_CG000896, isoform A [Clunio marinus]|uniref:CLUMA_CG000896, isoform A n=1 Tax=Clunio marinus TaxID=568069 RepID=A0A1J1HGI0_9DIPT|nr:CLUMA_CG000896, isoform A [Clunio marinus]
MYGNCSRVSTCDIFIYSSMLLMGYEEEQTRIEKAFQCTFVAAPSGMFTTPYDLVINTFYLIMAHIVRIIDMLNIQINVTLSE